MRVRARGWAAAAATLLLLASTAVAAPAALATYPGTDGSILFGVFDSSGGSNIWSANPDGTALTQVTSAKGNVICPAVSADGRELATCRSTKTGFEVWTSSIDGTGSRQLTHLRGNALFPDWNPLANRIVFSWARTPTDPASLYVVQTSSGKTRKLLDGHGYSLNYPVYSPDGSKVLFVRQKLDANGDAVTGQLWTMDLQTRHVSRLTSDAAVKDQTPDWSPDGSKIAYEADADIWIMNADGTGRHNLTNTKNAIEIGTAFSPDGQWIAFQGSGGPVPKNERYVQVMRVDGSDRHVLAATPGKHQAVPAWQPVMQTTS